MSVLSSSGAIGERCRRAYRSALLTSDGAGHVRYWDDALLVVGEGGKIEAVDRAPEAGRPGLIIEDLRGSLIIPGLVDAHVHYPQTRIIGSASGPLLDWLAATVFPEEAKFDDDAYAEAVAHEFFDRCAAAGTTAAATYASSHLRATEILFRVLDERGARGLVGLTLMEEGCPRELALDWSEASAALRSLARDYHGAGAGRLRLAVTPRFALSCRRASMEGAASIANELGLHVQTHVSENPQEGADTLAVHPFAKDYLGVYEAVGLVGPRTILAHAIHFSDEEWDRVAQRGATIAHCPDSNAFLGSGRMAIDRALSRGVNVALGSDVGAGRSFDVRRAMSYAYDNALAVGVALGPEQLFEMATMGGARALGLEREIGALTPGRDADFVVLARPSHARGREGALRCATFASEDAPVLRTYVRGRRLTLSRDPRSRGAD